MTPAQRVRKRLSASVAVVAEAGGYTWAWTAHGGKFLLAPLVDSWDGLSLNRFLAILFALNACHVHLVHWQLVRDNSPSSWQDIALATLAGSLAFGKDLFEIFLTRKATGSSTTTVHTEEQHGGE